MLTICERKLIEKENKGCKGDLAIEKCPASQTILLQYCVLVCASFLLDSHDIKAICCLFILMNRKT